MSIAATQLTGTVGGAAITANPNVGVFLNGSPIVVFGADVMGHGAPPHFIVNCLVASTTVLINGLGIVRAGDLATCSHAMVVNPVNTTNVGG